MSAVAMSFSDAHVAELEASGITSAVAHAAGLWSEGDAARVTKLLAKRRGAFGPQHMPTLVFPYLRPEGGGEPHLWRVKPATPYDSGDDRPQKYVQASGTGVVLYWPPSLLDGDRRRRDVTQGLIVTEGEKKTLSAESAGFACVGLGGVSNWSRRLRGGKRVLLAEWELVELEGRSVAICFDSDSSRNINVRREEMLFAERLSEAGAKVRVVRLPEIDGQKVGLDDYLVSKGADALRKLIAATSVWEPPAESKREKRERTELAQAPAIGTALTDIGNAERLVAAHGPDLLFVEPWKSWMTWTGARWKRDENGESMRRAITTVRAMYAEAASPLLDRDTAAAVADHAKKSESASRLRDLLRVAQAQRPAMPDEFDRDRWLFACGNGVIDLRTGKLREHRREDRVTKGSKAEYEPACAVPVWLAFLERVLPDAEVRAFIQRFVGYCLTGDVSEQVLVFLYGTGANGKSTFLNVLFDLFGEYGLKAPSSLLFASQNEQHPAAVADLCGVRLAVSSESKSGAAFDEALVKDITGGEPLRARYFHQGWFTFEPTHKMLHSANHRPVVKGGDEGIWRRLREVPFEAFIPPEERDHLLGEKLRAEMPGILAWAVAGCLQWQRVGLGEPAAVRAATAAYREDSDIIGLYLESECVLQTRATAWARQLYEAYEKWCARNGETPMKQRSFGRALSERGLRRVKGTGGIFRWEGVGIRDDHQEDDADSGRRDDSGRRTYNSPCAGASVNLSDIHPLSSLHPLGEKIEEDRGEDPWSSLSGGKP